MRALVVTLLLVLAGPAAAEQAPPPTPAAPAPPPAAPAPARVQLPSHGRVDGVAIDPNDLPITDLDRGRGTRRPSGFWTGYRPARSGAYRWPLLGVAIVTIAITVFFLRRLLRRSTGPGRLAR